VNRVTSHTAYIVPGDSAQPRARKAAAIGPLHPKQQSVGSSDAGSTHAWAELYVLGAGWITFDPTNRSVGGFNLIPVAVVRDIRQAIPVSGSFVGAADAFAGMSVEVLVTSESTAQL
jgi:transglutaminase-like putative cysteine protease